MQSARIKLSVLFMFLAVMSACALRFFQLLKLTDAQTGTVSKNNETSFFVYGILLILVISTAIYSYFKKSNDNDLSFEKCGKSVFLSALILAVTFFVDFIHQCYNCYAYVESVTYVEYTYIIPLVISAVLAIFSCFYFIVYALTLKGANYDFRNFTVFHFVPSAWAFTRLCIIMSKLVDPLDGVETCIEFLTLVLVICFMFSLVSAVDKKDGSLTGVLWFSSITLFCVSLILTLPRIIMIISGNGKMLFDINFSLGTYLMFGIFAFTVIRDINKRKVKDN